uniref:Uncharacterized protein n=1 Tax=Oryza nivara TaxID=4536 RepID=A0A0E0FSW7_ORYNI
MGKHGGSPADEEQSWASGGGEVACVGPTELLVGRRAEHIPEYSIVTALGQDFGPLRDPPHGRLPDARRRPHCRIDGAMQAIDNHNGKSIS